METVIEEGFENKSVYDVQIAGISLRLKTAHDEQTMKQLVALVNKKVEEVSDGHSSKSKMPVHNALLLASLHMAEDMIGLREKTSAQLESLELQVKQLLAAMDSSAMSRIRLDN